MGNNDKNELQTNKNKINNLKKNDFIGNNNQKILISNNNDEIDNLKNELIKAKKIIEQQKLKN